jgi:hypothetical protein
MPQAFQDPLTSKIAGFLAEIGLEVEPSPLTDKTFLPGILVRNGRLLVDEAKLKYPGDLLHEAGHLAVSPAKLRPTLSDEVELPEVNMDAIEAHSIAWSYAAALHLNLDPAVVFHPDGYKGQAESLLFNFRIGAYLGVNGLVESGMTAIGARAGELGTPPYPHMIKWLRD